MTKRNAPAHKQAKSAFKKKTGNLHKEKQLG